MRAHSRCGYQSVESGEKRERKVVGKRSSAGTGEKERMRPMFRSCQQSILNINTEYQHLPTDWRDSAEMMPKMKQDGLEQHPIH